ncbi:hypothetical protein SLEP1_g30975 [Rubroshorea leprosula]|uniref:Uncharacterized protein n=1 Tax=Rubroshorea leprosula TaxID=152421 RepID=A0AAV5K873_9ROSI|nr:hypothetical protein SLEP1_g30975 [Rubroshorea leprosula]
MGNKISFWYDTWVGKDPLSSVIYGPHHVNAPNITVRDALLSSGEWNCDLISYSLLTDIVNRLRAIPFKFSDAGTDTFIWGCHQAPETLNHIFREGFLAKLLWSLLTPHPINNLFHDLDFDDWLFAHFNQSKFSGFEGWSTSFSYIIWSLWYFRNLLVHEKKNFSLVMARDFILSKINEYKQLHPVSLNTKTIYTVFVGWNPPPPGVVKLNTDGSVVTNPGNAGAGGIFRDDLGN